jgi:hypothetical protein
MFWEKKSTSDLTDTTLRCVFISAKNVCQRIKKKWKDSWILLGTLRIYGYHRLLIHSKRCIKIVVSSAVSTVSINKRFLSHKEWKWS